MVVVEVRDEVRMTAFICKLLSTAKYAVLFPEWSACLHWLRLYTGLISQPNFPSWTLHMRLMDAWRALALYSHRGLVIPDPNPVTSDRCFGTRWKATGASLACGRSLESFTQPWQNIKIKKNTLLHWHTVHLHRHTTTNRQPHGLVWLPDRLSI